MITVTEVWRLKPGLDGRALELMQEMDDLVGPDAHRHRGWRGHARFLQNVDRPSEVVMEYLWQSVESHADLRRREDVLLRDFYATYCASPREIRYYDELEVEVEHDHDDHQHGDRRESDHDHDHGRSEQ